MVAATANPDLSSAETLTDDALIAEIAPAMQDKLKNDGRLLGGLCSQIFLLASLLLFGVADHVAGTQSLDIIDYARLAAIAACIAGAFILPRWCAGRSIRREIKYRREHGKWRWDH